MTPSRDLSPTGGTTPGGCSYHWLTRNGLAAPTLDALQRACAKLIVKKLAVGDLNEAGWAGSCLPHDVYLVYSEPRVGMVKQVADADRLAAGLECINRSYSDTVIAAVADFIERPGVEVLWTSGDPWMRARMASDEPAGYNGRGPPCCHGLTSGPGSTPGSGWRRCPRSSSAGPSESLEP